MRGFGFSSRFRFLYRSIAVSLFSTSLKISCSCSLSRTDDSLRCNLLHAAAGTIELLGKTLLNLISHDWTYSLDIITLFNFWISFSFVCTTFNIFNSNHQYRSSCTVPQPLTQEIWRAKMDNITLRLYI